MEHKAQHSQTKTFAARLRSIFSFGKWRRAKVAKSDAASADAKPARRANRLPQPLRRLLQNLSDHPLLTRLDRYIIYKFLSTYIFLIGIIISIAIIFDYNEKIDKFEKAHVSWTKIAFDYYLNFIPYFSNLFSPLFVFIAVIFFTSKLADNSEIIAMKSTGMSFRRLLRPYMISAAIIALTSFGLGAYVIPKGNVARVNFENRYIKKLNAPTSVENVQMQVDTGVVVYISRFDNETKSGYGFSLDKFYGKKLVDHLTAQSIQYDTLAGKKNQWTLRQVQQRKMRGLRERISYADKVDSIIMMEPQDFFYVRNQQETMTVPELRQFIDKQQMRGAAGVSLFEVEYHKRFAMPFAAFILTLIGVSLSSQKRKNGMGTSIGVGIALSFSYILFQTISSSFAVNANWSPMLSVWIPNLLFVLIAFGLYKRTPQ